jgi:hypothetical protein
MLISGTIYQNGYVNLSGHVKRGDEDDAAEALDSYLRAHLDEGPDESIVLFEMHKGDVFVLRRHDTLAIRQALALFSLIGEL